MKTKHVILISILVFVVFLGTIAMFVYKTFTGGPTPSQRVDTNTEQTQNQINNSTTTATTTNTTNIPPPDNHTALDDCIELKANEAKGKEYERGSLLVSFFNSLSYSLALDTIKLLGLRPDDSTEAKNNFNQNHWLTVFVPKGKEFEWQCKLDASEGIKKANLNLTFNLRQ